MGHGAGKAHADGRTGLDEPLSLQLARGVAEGTQQHAVVGGERTLREGFSAEKGESDVVGGAMVHKLCGHVLGRGDAVGGDVLREHTRGDVHGKYNVDALGLVLVPRVRGLWAGHHQHHCHEAEEAEEEGQMYQPVAPRPRRIPEGFGSRQGQGPLVPLAEEEVPQDVGHDEQQEEKEIWTGKSHGLYISFLKVRFFEKFGFWLNEGRCLVVQWLYSCVLKSAFSRQAQVSKLPWVFWLNENVQRAPRWATSSQPRIGGL